jgi:hypothetical protein
MIGNTGSVAIASASIDLTAFGQVPDDYTHDYRMATSGKPLVTGGAAFKWYDIVLQGATVPPDVDRSARDLLLADPILNSGPLGHGLGAVFAHYTASGTFIGAGVWCNHNELWMSVWWRVHGPDTPWERVERGDLAPVLCVYELGPVCHERMCWHRYLFSAQDEAAKQAWLADTMSGMV